MPKTSLLRRKRKNRQQEFYFLLTVFIFYFPMHAFTHVRKFSVAEPVLSASVCPCPHTVSKSTCVSSLYASAARARFTSVHSAVSPWTTTTQWRKKRAFLMHYDLLNAVVATRKTSNTHTKKIPVIINAHTAALIGKICRFKNSCLLQILAQSPVIQIHAKKRG